MLKYLLKYTYRAEDYRLEDTVSKVTWWFKKWGVDLTIDMKRTKLSELEEKNYETNNDGTKSLARDIVALEWEPNYTGVLLFANKDDAHEKATLRGQQNRAMRNGVSFGVLEVYSQPNRFVRLIKGSEGWKYSGTTRERGSAFRQDVYVTIHEILHDMADIIGIPDGLHQAVLDNRFIAYAESLCKQYQTFLKLKVPERPVETETPLPPQSGGFKNPPIKFIVIHHTAVTRASGNSQLKAVDTYHKNKDWGGGYKQSAPSSLGYYVGYNYFLDVDGKLTQTRAVGTETIAQIGHNCDVFERCDAVSVCLAGDFNIELPNDKQIASLRTTLEKLQVEYPFAKIVFHSELQAGRTCAGKLFTHDYLKTRILQENIPTPDPEDKQKQETIENLMKQVSLYEQVVALFAKLFKSKNV